MYNYEKALPKGFYIEKEIIGGSSARVFILINNKGDRIVRKISDVEGINKNGKEKLKKEINFLEYFHNTKSEIIYPQIYNYEANDLYVYYDMSFLEGKTLQELLRDNKKEEAFDCCNKVLDDLCFYSDIQKTNSDNEMNLIYKSYIDKTKNVIEKLLNNNKISNLIQSKEIIINNKKYKNAKIVHEYLYKNEIQKRLRSNEVSFCFHGDLVSSNILYNNGIINYIDPRGDFNKFDICYDIAKMKFSFSGYEQVINNEFILFDSAELINFKLKEEPLFSFTNEKFFTLLRKNEMFSDNIIKQDGYWKERIRMHVALQYINNSYVQLESGCLDKFIVMYSIGTIKLNELLNRLY